MTGAGDGVDARATVMAPARFFLLRALVAVGALLSVGAAVAVAVRISAPLTPLMLALAAGAFAATQLARVQLRVGSATVHHGWGEVGIVAILCLVPPVWAPAVIAVGAAIGHLYRAAGAGRAQRGRVYYSFWLVTVGGSVASAVAMTMTSPTVPVRVGLDQPQTFAALLLAALAHFIVTGLLVSAWVAGTSHNEFMAVWTRTITLNLHMLLGNLAVSFTVAAVIALDPRWLAVLAPVLLVIHQLYTHQARSVQESRTWTALADATRDLNHLDEQHVVASALDGAAGLFGADEVEVALMRATGARHSYRLRGGHVQTEMVADPTAETARTSSAELGVVEKISRRLVVGGRHLGELVLRFDRPIEFTTPDQLAVSTFADALASALHDAATHWRLQAMTARSAYDAVHDPLTNLSNRSALVARGNAELTRMRPDDLVAMILLDIDKFRNVNESLGHAAGDLLLEQLAHRLDLARQPGELIGRFGGDEFAIIVTTPASAVPSDHPESTNGDRTGDGPDEREHGRWTYPLDRARRLTATLAAPIEISGMVITREASAGVAVATAGACDMTELARRAELALHHAKREGMGVACYDWSSDVMHSDRLALLADLRDALSTTDQLAIMLLPTVDLISGDLVAVEALARWQHPRRGLLLPQDFMDVIENSDLVAGLTYHVLDLALAVAAQWSEHGVRLPVGVNLSARCMLDEQLPTRVLDLLTQHRIPAQQLVLEVTERVSEVEHELVEPVLAQLRAAGVQISIDDFGTGAASLKFLARFRVDEVKIDRSFVAEMDDSPEVAAIVRATIEMARDLGLRIVAEGVEFANQRTALCELGVGAAQGYLFHEPLTVAAATALVRDSGWADSPACAVPAQN